MKFLMTILTTIVLATFVVAPIGCTEEQTPGEKAEERLEEVGEELEDAVTDDGPVEQAGEKVDDVVEDVKDDLEEARRKAEERLAGERRIGEEKRRAAE